MADTSSSAAKEPVLLDVPLRDKDRARAAGARWDPEGKVWFVRSGTDLAAVTPWLPDEKRAAALKEEVARRRADRASRVLLDVPFREKEQAKAAGATFDGGFWWAPGGATMAPLQRWVPTPERAEEMRSLAETCAALNSQGIRPQTHNAPLFRGTWTERDREVRFLDLGVSGGAWRDQGLWLSNEPPKAPPRIVVVERPEDAMAHYQLAPDPRSRYVALGRTAHELEALDPAQAARLRDLLTASGASAVVNALSNSRQGAALARELRDLAPDLPCERNAPTHGRWWTDTLAMKERDFIQRASRGGSRRAVWRAL